MEIQRSYSSIQEIPLPSPLGENIYARLGQKPLVELPDPGVDKLIRVISGLGMQTTGSCEGHMNRYQRYPWVQIAGLQYPDFWVHQEMVRLSAEYGIQKPAHQPEWFVHLWRKDEALLRTREEADSEAELIRLRQGSDDFAQFLFDKYLRVKSL